MIRAIAIGTCSLAFVALAGFTQPADQPAQTPTIETHPPAGHPMLPKPGDDWPQPKAEDVASIDAIVAAYYASTSGKSGEPRDWNRFKSLFHPQGRLIPAHPVGDGSATAFFLTAEDFAQQNDKYFKKSGFIDREVAKRVEQYGNIAQVWSTYESRRGQENSDPYSRGIASIQLLKDGGRWWILNVAWDYERPDNLIPEKYRQSPKE